MQTIFSAMQPTGTLTIGNYFGAIYNWKALQDKYNCIYAVADLHSITIRQNPKEFRENCLKTLALYIACGLDYEKNVIFIQSSVAAHSELAWILNCYAYLGELSRMTQFKDKSSKSDDNNNLGLFAYPVLQGADILLYQTHLVPVGEDQKQHLELSRDIAQRFNNVYGKIFEVPEPFISKSGGKIMSLTNPTAKMSKSDETSSFISLLDDKDAILKKIKRSTTDSDGKIIYDKANKPGVSNLLEIYALSNDIKIEQAEEEFQAKGYGDLKIKTAEALLENIISPIQNKYNELIKNQDLLNNIIIKNGNKAGEIAQKTIDTVKKAIGLVNF